MQMLRKIAIWGVFALLFSATSFAQEVDTVFSTVFNSKLTAEELESLQKGQTVIRNIGKMKNVCIEPSRFDTDSPVRSAYDVMNKLDPAYLAEVIQVRPITGNENLAAEIYADILDIKSYVGIPYWSVRHERYFELYSDAQIISHVKDGAKEHIQADLTMEPFGVINSSIDTELREDSFYYLLTNMNDLYLDSFKCVKSKNMISAVAVVKYGNYWILYGIGGVDAPSIFFLRNRIETSFINRIKTFCAYFFSTDKESANKE